MKLKAYDIGLLEDVLCFVESLEQIFSRFANQIHDFGQTTETFEAVDLGSIFLDFDAIMNFEPALKTFKCPIYIVLIADAQFV
jgi:hypothetical protein